jgi:hypothetical protein
MRHGLKATLPVAQSVKSGGRIVVGNVSATIEAGSVCERAPWPGSVAASLARRRPQSRWSQAHTAVQTPASRVGHPRRGPTSGIPETATLGDAPGLRALASASRSAPVRPNYAFERRLVEL